MTRPMVRIVETNGTVIDREMNDAEFAQYQLDTEAELTANAKRDELNNKRKELLDRLGLTAEEAQVLLG